MNKKELFNEEREISGQQKVVCVGCEPERQVIKASSQNGVTMYVDKGLNAVVDMDVEDWVTAVEFNSNVEMRDCNKKFLNVEKLIIGPAVDKININNETFPGVKYVDSKNIYYVSGKYLIY